MIYLSDEKEKDIAKPILIAENLAMNKSATKATGFLLKGERKRTAQIELTLPFVKNLS